MRCSVPFRDAFASGGARSGSSIINCQVCVHTGPQVHAKPGREPVHLSRARGEQGHPDHDQPTTTHLPPAGLTRAHSGIPAIDPIQCRLRRPRLGWKESQVLLPSGGQGHVQVILPGEATTASAQRSAILQRGVACWPDGSVTSTGIPSSWPAGGSLFYP